MTVSLALWATIAEFNCPLLTSIWFVDPIPTVSIFINSSLILITSPEKNDDIPVNVIKSVSDTTSNDSFVLIGDCMTGLWMLLSSVTKTLELRFVEVNDWVVPTPTDVISRTVGTLWSASVALAATLNLFSAILTAYTLEGRCGC